MQTKIHPRLTQRPDIIEADEILRACVHCGFCTAVCPTYQLLGDELDGPRGRIYLIKNLLEEGDITRSSTDHLDRCLTCRACETACPSGVEYGRLLDIGRGLIAERNTQEVTKRFKSLLLGFFVPRRHLFGFVLAVGRTLKPLMPRALASLIPARRSVQLPAQENAPVNGPAGVSVRRVLVLDGCVQQAATPGVNVALRHLLGTQSVEVVSLPGEGCCGAVQYHLADHAGGEKRMQRMIDRLLPILDDYEYIVSSASGCGVTLKDYPRILAHDPAYADKAKTVASKIVDVSELLADMQFDCEPARVAFHSPCTLQHGQKLDGAVEEILRKAGMNLVPVRDAHLCCGSAGTYSIMQPDLSNQLRANKITALQAEQPEFIVSANIGCQLHLDAEANSTVLHWVELLALRLKSV